MRHHLFIPACLCAASLLVGCHQQPRAPLPAAAQQPVPAVRVQPVQSKNYLTTEEVVGTVYPRLKASIEAKTRGQIEKMLVSAGQPVKKGELLVQLDAREIQARLDQAKATRDQAERDLQRMETLLKQTAVTQSEFDAAQARFRVSEAAVREAQTMLDYATITAPFDGVVTRKLANVGDLASPGRPLLEIEDSNSLRLEADIPESLIHRLQLNATLPVYAPSLTNKVDATVSEIAPIAAPNSRTFLVKLDLPANAGLRAGQFGRVFVPLGQSSNLRVPVSAVVRRGQLEIVFVVLGQHAQLRLVKTGRRLGDEVEILSGLEVGESIVTDGAAALVDGQPVEVKS